MSRGLEVPLLSESVPEPASEAVPRGVDLRLGTLACGTWIGALLGVLEQSWVAIVVVVIGVLTALFSLRDIGLMLSGFCDGVSTLRCRPQCGCLRCRYRCGCGLRSCLMIGGHRP